MKKSILCVSIIAALCMGCAVDPEVHKVQGNELKALGEYHKAEKKAVRADKASKAAGGAFVAATAAKMLADQELNKAKAALDEALNK
ncbi:MAG: hypothetical protein ACRCXB_22730 [Aeromonadaceae bacterium]